GGGAGGARPRGLRRASNQGGNGAASGTPSALGARRAVYATRMSRSRAASQGLNGGALRRATAGGPGRLVRPAGVEPAALGLGVPCSIQLSYGRATWGILRPGAAALNRRRDARAARPCPAPRSAHVQVVAH